MNDRSVVESNNSPNYKLLASLRVSPCPDHPCINQYCLNYHSALERRRNPYSKHTFLYAPLLCNGPCKGDVCSLLPRTVPSASHKANWIFIP